MRTPVMLPLLPLLSSPRLAIEIEAPKVVQSGREFRVKARLVNRSDKPIVIVRPTVPNNPLGMSYGGGLFQGGKAVKTASFGQQGVQWMMPWHYGPEAFQTLRPGDSVPIENIEYRQVWTEREPSLKSEIDKLPRADLPPGEYTLRFSYGFRPELHRNGHPFGRNAPRLELTPTGRPLYKTAWTGLVKGEAALIVSAA